VKKSTNDKAVAGNVSKKGSTLRMTIIQSMWKRRHVRQKKKPHVTAKLKPKYDGDLDEDDFEDKKFIYEILDKTLGRGSGQKNVVFSNGPKTVSE
jgi:hypothetical protein